MSLPSFALVAGAIVCVALIFSTVPSLVEASAPLHAATKGSKGRHTKLSHPLQQDAVNQHTGRSVGSGNCESNPWPTDRQNNRIFIGSTLAPAPPNGPFTPQNALFSKNAVAFLDASTGLLTVQSTMAAIPAASAQLWTSSMSSTAPATLRLTTSGIQLVNTSGAVYDTIGGANSGNGPFPDTAVLVLHDNCDLAVFARPPFDTELFATDTSVCLSVHVVPHSHDDVGWLLTPERYYDGCYDPQGGVQSIISSMVEALSAKPDRTFVEVEQYFFHRWWQRQSEETKAQTRTIVKAGQMQFINGGWSMHDEACVHQESAIANMGRGAQFLRQEFGIDTNLTIGWHIDPFGHASTTPRLMAQMGFNAFFFQRTDWQHREYMIQTKTLESMWLPSPSLGGSVAMFTSIMADGYCKGCDNGLCPSGFCCFSCEDAAGPNWAYELAHMERRLRPQTEIDRVRRQMKLRSDTRLTISDIALQTLQDFATYAKYFRTDQVLIPWGCDFEHIDAPMSFDLMDQVMAEIKQQQPQFNMFYSTPQRYVSAVQAEKYVWPSNFYDYFLDSDDAHSYWSGYFSSRAEYKHWERTLMSQRRTAEVMLTQVQPDPDSFSERWNALDTLRQALGVAQHHDSITGTERHSVRNQYQKILTDGMVQTAAAQSSLFTESTGMEAPAFCTLANLSTCLDTNTLATQGTSITVVLFNPLPWARTGEIATIPVPTQYITVTLLNGGNTVPSQVQDVWALTTSADPPSPPTQPQQYELLIALPEMAPLSYTTLLLTPSQSALPTYIPATNVLGNSNISIANSNGSLTVVVNSLTGLVSVSGPATGAATTALAQSYAWYCPMDNTDGQPAGAYIMRTCTPDPEPTSFGGEFIATTVVIGPVCSEVRQMVDTANSLQQRVRVCQDDDFFTLTTGIGPLYVPTTGKEAVLRLTVPDVRNDGLWFTDSEALELQTRTRNARPNYPYNLSEPIASNFFPANQWAMITDRHAEPGFGTTLAVVADMSRATASLHDGELEFLLMRRLLFDDNRGVAQALNESIRLITSSRVYVTATVDAATCRARSAAVHHTHPSPAFISQQNMVPSYSDQGPITGASIAAATALPPNVMLHTRDWLNDRQMIVRLQHLYAADECEALSVPVTVRLSTILPPAVASFTAVEMDINAVTSLEDINAARQQYDTCIPAPSAPQVPTIEALPTPFVPALGPDGDSVTLNPMDIRTFVVTVQWAN